MHFIVVFCCCSVDKRSIADPLVDMRDYLDVKKKSTKDILSASSSAISSKHRVTDHGESRLCDHEKKKKKSHKEDKKLLLQKMREDRKRRENEERAKAEKLLKKHHGLEDEQPISKSIEEIPGRYGNELVKCCKYNILCFHYRYNSQYNPHLARNRRN